MGCGAWGQGKVEPVCPGCSECQYGAGLSAWAGQSQSGSLEPAAQELEQGKCSVKVRVRTIGLSEGRGRVRIPESTGRADSGGQCSPQARSTPGDQAGAAPAPSADPSADGSGLPGGGETQQGLQEASHSSKLCLL